MKIQTVSGVLSGTCPRRGRRSPWLPLLLLISVFSVVSLQADSKEQSFPANYDATWAACVKAANSEFTLEHSEKESGVLSFRTGTSMTSWGFTVGVTVEAIDANHTRVTLNPQKERLQFAWGAGGRIAKKFFKAVEKEMKKESKQ